MLVVLVLFTTVLLRVALVCWVVYLLLPRGARCRSCQADMLRLQNRVLDACLPFLERRWCLTCGWNGVVRRGRPAEQPLAPRPHVPAPPTWE